MNLDMKKVLIIMARKCMTDKVLIEKSGLPIGTFNQIKNGSCKAKPISIGRIAKGLEVDVTEIIED